jgi:thymidine phosphorylase
MNDPGQANQHHAQNILAILRKQRNGAELTRKEIEYLVHQYTRGEIPDHQAAGG